MGLKKNFIYNSFLTLSTYIFGLITFPYVSRVLGVQNIGIVNFVDNIINYFILFSSLGLAILGVREIAQSRGNKIDLSRTFSSLLTINITFTAVALIIYLIFINVIPQLEEYKNLLYIGVFKILFSVFLIEWLYKGLENFKYITLRTLIIKLIYVISIFVFVQDSKDIYIYFSLTIVVVIVNAITNILYIKGITYMTFHRLEIKKYLKPYCTLGIYMLLTSMYTSFNVVYLGITNNTVEVGYYTTAIKIYSIILGFFTAFTSVMLPRMSSLLNEGKTSEFVTMIQKSFNILFSISIPLAIFSLFEASVLIEILSGKGYEGSIIPMQIIMPLIIIVGIAQILAVQILMPLKKDRIVLNASILGAITGVLLNIILVKELHSIGTAVVLLCSEFIVTAYYCLAIKKEQLINIPFRLFFKHLIVSVPYFIICITFNSLGLNIYISVLLVIISFLIYFLFANVYLLNNNPLNNIDFNKKHN